MTGRGSKNQPLVTVLMPVCNAAGYLREAVESILRQTFSDFEFLIVEDGSTDESPEILATYLDSRIRILKNETNLGVTASLNRGLREARGAYIARMDADDISLPDRLERQIEFMEENPDVGVSSAWLKPFGTRTGTVWASPTSDEEIRAVLFSDSCIWHPCVIFRKALIEQHGLEYEEAYPGSEDYRLWTRLAQHTRLANLPTVLLHYRMHKQQVTRRGNSSQSIREELLEDFLERAVTPQEKNLHAELHFEHPFSDGQTLDNVIRWAGELKSRNRMQETYTEPAFSSQLEKTIRTTKRRCFHHHYENSDRYTPATLLRLYFSRHRFYAVFPREVLFRLTLKSLLFYPVKPGAGSAEPETGPTKAAPTKKRRAEP